MRPASRAVSTVVASDSTSTVDTPASSTSSRRKRPVGLIVGALVAVAAIVGAFVVFGGSDETAEGDVAGSDTPSAGSEPAGNSDQPEVVDSAAPVESTTTQPSESPQPSVAVTVPDTGLALTIEVCAADAAGVSHFAVTDSGLYMLTPDGLKSADAASLSACNIDVAGAPLAVLAVPADPIDVAGFGTRLAVSAPSGGVVFNEKNGESVTCADLTGYVALTDDGALFTVDGDVVTRYVVDEVGCTAEDTTSFADMAASSIAIGGRRRLAITGTERSSGAIRLWVFNGANDVKRVDGFVALDGVVRCGELWCALDVAAGVIHVVDIDGKFLGDAPLSSGLPSPVTEVLDLTSNDATGAFTLVRLSDGSTSILRLQN